VIIDDIADGKIIGRSKADAPDIDGVVHLNAGKKRLLPGQIVNVVITDSDAYDLFGKLA
jgi:ribosomal protein S12 methylthiotransferase